MPEKQKKASKDEDSASRKSFMGIFQYGKKKRKSKKNSATEEELKKKPVEATTTKEMSSPPPSVANDDSKPKKNMEDETKMDMNNNAPSSPEHAPSSSSTAPGREPSRRDMMGKYSQPFSTRHIDGIEKKNLSKASSSRSELMNKFSQPFSVRDMGSRHGSDVSLGLSSELKEEETKETTTTATTTTTTTTTSTNGDDTSDPRRSSTLKVCPVKNDKELLVDEALKELLPYKNLKPLTNADKVLVMQGWNKVLAFKTSFSEALLLHWRILCCHCDAANDNNFNDTDSDYGLHEPAGSGGGGKEIDAMKMMEENKDPLFQCFQQRLIVDAEELLMSLLDTAVRSLCPRNQIVQREAYRPALDDHTLQKFHYSVDDLTLECISLQDHLDLFARLGILPQYWVCFIESVVWAFSTHTPYAQDDDIQDIEKGTLYSVFGRVVALQVAVPAIETYQALVTLYRLPIVQQLQTIWCRFSEEGRINFGEAFYRRLLTGYPELLDYFSNTNMDALSIHLSMALDLVIRNVHSMGSATSSFRNALNLLGESHRSIGIPTYTYALVGGTILDSFEDIFAQEEKDTKDSDNPVLAKDLRSTLLKVYAEIMSVIYYPMLRQERLMKDAKEFYGHIQEELNWSDSKLQRRMLQIEMEIANSGTYHQTAEELELGARLAWRNSAKCIGRISWNTLKVNDCRHVKDPKAIFAQVEKHLLEATAGTNIQSVMTVFQPKGVYEPLGVRFLSSQYVRYAAYADEVTGKVLGDPANLEMTNYLVEEKLWSPPEEKTAFDILPLVLKLPGKKIPLIHHLPKECIFEVDLEHPTKPELSKLGLRWTTVPAISNFKMNLGGVIYQNMPFNGWFVSTEIVRNLMERYENVDSDIAKAIGLDINTDPMWRQNASIELERMVVHSFQKNGYTIVDPMTVGKSFCTHVQREREEFGRECPGQWSWIGGLVGPTNPTWHMEMRDFLVNPQYAYACEDLLVHHAAEEKRKKSTDDPTLATADETLSLSTIDSTDLIQEIPNVLIVYGSETGNAESVARRLKNELRSLKPTFKSLNQVSKDLPSMISKKRITHVIAVCSTFGKGNPPANAQDFFSTADKALSSSTWSHDADKKTQFAVLAMGSTIYPDFCQAGIQLDQILSDVGLEQLANLVKADEASGSEATIDEWLYMIKNLIFPSSLQQYMAERSDGQDDKPPIYNMTWTEDIPEDFIPPSAQDMDNGSLCVSNQELLENCEDRSKSIRKITFETPAPYHSGDHLSVLPQNSDAMIKRFLTCFESQLSAAFVDTPAKDVDDSLGWIAKQPFNIQALEGNQVAPADVFFETPTSLEYILKCKLDLTLKSKDVPELMTLLKRLLDEKMSTLSNEDKAGLMEEEDLQELLSNVNNILNLTSTARTSALDLFVAKYPTVVHFLEAFSDILLGNYFGPEPVLGLAELLVVLKRLQPRYYSISSSNRINAKEVSITVGVLNVKTSQGVMINGVCSNYLAGLEGGKEKAVVSVHTSSFRLPEDPEAPIIMVGAGTGLSPMMGFLEDKALDAKNGITSGPIHLFFGCRTEKDVIYKDLIEDLERQGLLRFHLALSRSKNTPKKYVQNKIEDMGPVIVGLLKRKDTQYYVCGDARMADSCYEACVNLLRKHAVMSRISAVNTLKHMRLDGRWQTDVWGIVSHFEDAKKDMMKKKRMAAKLWMQQFNQDD